MRIKRKTCGFILVLISCTYVFYKSQSMELEPKLPKTIDSEKVELAHDLVTDIGLVRNEEDMKKREKGYFYYALNVLVSDRIGLDRAIPDTRHEKCKDLKKSFGTLKKNASVVITFHNEATTTLLRTVTSVLNRTPKELLHEIILFDDYSDLIDLQAIQSFVDQHKPLVKFLHAKKREGLIRGKLNGAKAASGDVLVFLDSHCEVNKDWLQPLLLRIESNGKVVVSPVIDMINPNSFEYSASTIVRGGFNWAMGFTWESVPPDPDLNPEYDAFMSPTMAGGLFAVDRNYFFKMGGYDEGMEIWGGENLEISFRMWMCGGRLEIVPCSRVGHIFRTQSSSESNWTGKDSSNSVRVVEVWLDEYKKHFYALKPHLEGKKPDVQARKELRENLYCNSFNWYLTAIYPQVGIPGVRDPAFSQSGSTTKKKETGKKAKLLHSSYQCLDTYKLVPKAPLVLKECNSLELKSWTFHSNNEIRASSRLCLDVILTRTSSHQVRVMKCHGQKSGQEWKFMDSQHLYNPSTGMCLEASKDIVTMEICSKKSKNQKWKLQIEM